jgi:hypothetical protein
MNTKLETGKRAPTLKRSTARAAPSTAHLLRISTRLQPRHIHTHPGSGRSPPRSLRRASLGTPRVSWVRGGGANIRRPCSTIAFERGLRTTSAHSPRWLSVKPASAAFRRSVRLNLCGGRSAEVCSGERVAHNVITLRCGAVSV